MERVGGGGGAQGYVCRFVLHRPGVAVTHLGIVSHTSCVPFIAFGSGSIFSYDLNP